MVGNTCWYSSFQGLNDVVECLKDTEFYPVLLYVALSGRRTTDAFFLTNTYGEEPPLPR